MSRLITSPRLKSSLIKNERDELAERSSGTPGAAAAEFGRRLTAIMMLRLRARIAVSGMSPHILRVRIHQGYAAFGSSPRTHWRLTTP